MGKGSQTRERIIRQSAELFNQRGYAGSSLGDIMEKTGLQKGGIYRHFSSKDEIAVEAYKFAAGVVGGVIADKVADSQNAMGKLLAYFDVYANVAEKPPFIGGCPLLNTAVESDDAHPELRGHAQIGLSRTLDALEAILSEGQANREFREGIDKAAIASFVLASLEGSIMMSKLEGSNRHVEAARQQVENYLLVVCSPANQHRH